MDLLFYMNYYLICESAPINLSAVLEYAQVFKTISILKEEVWNKILHTFKYTCVKSDYAEKNIIFI